MILYTSPNGKQVSNHSYSASQLWACPKKYFYQKVQGYQSRQDRVQTTFGSVVEAALQWFHQHNFEPESGQDEFRRLWAFYRNDSSLVYTPKTGDWEDHYKMGVEILALYEVSYHRLPVDNAVFQNNFQKELFPDTEYSGLGFTSFVDMVSTVRYDHPLLPPVSKIPENGKRKVVIDIKTTSLMYPSDPRLYALDPQLRDYAWVSGIDSVAFLTLVKSRSAVESGDRVSLLKTIGSPEFDTRYFPVGSEVFVLDIDESGVIVLESEGTYNEYQGKVKEIKGKGSKAAKEELMTKYVLQYGFRIPLNHITKQRIQFLAAVIPPKEQEEIGEQIGQETVDIANANLTGNYPKIPGVRFPHAVCQGCEMLGLCINDPQITKERLIQISGDF